MKPTGYVLHETDRIVVISTGHARRSQNPKTGDMIQVWILARRVDPLVAVRTGKDSLVCGDCKLGPGAEGKRSCYVSLRNAPLAIWRAYKRGNYPRLDLDAIPAVFQRRAVRFGAYGDPVLIPATVINAIVKVCSNWTGYTHQWRNPLLRGFQTVLMASVDSLAEREQAQSLGWRTFRVSTDGAPHGREIECPAYTRGIQCQTCGLCKGTAIGAKSIVIQVHGAGKGNFTQA